MKVRLQGRAGGASDMRRPMAVLALVVLVAGSCLGPPTVRAEHRLSGGKEQIEHGHCAGCHGDDRGGERYWERSRPTGAIPAPPLGSGGRAVSYSNDELFLIIQQGVDALGMIGYDPTMPEYWKVLTDEEIWATVAYIRSTWPKADRDRQKASVHLP